MHFKLLIAESMALSELQPLAHMSVFTILFTHLQALDTEREATDPDHLDTVLQGVSNKILD